MPDFSISSCAFLGFDPGEPWDIPTNDVLKDGSENIQFTQHKTIFNKNKAQDILVGMFVANSLAPNKSLPRAFKLGAACYPSVPAF